MKKPTPRPDDLPPRRGDRNPRLSEQPDPQLIEDLLARAHYVGSSKHKANPHLYGLPPFLGNRGDATLCDTHSGFLPEHLASIPKMLQRGIRAGLVGTSGQIWTISETGWIYECRLTNPTQAEYHGFPVRGSEAIGELVYHRFVAWAHSQGGPADQAVAKQCRALYGFRS
jgi:hypothetical protein